MPIKVYKCCSVIKLPVSHHWVIVTELYQETPAHNCGSVGFFFIKAKKLCVK